MSISESESKQLLKRLVFEDSNAEEWIQDVWALSPTLGETAARLIDVLDGVMECAHPEKLENMLHSLYQEKLDP